MASDLSKIKSGVENSIKTLAMVKVKGIDEGRDKGDPLNAKNLKEIKGSFVAYEDGITGVKSMLDFVYEHSLREGIDNDEWLEGSIKTLIKLSDNAINDLMKGVIMKLPKDKSDQTKEFFEIKNGILKDFGVISKVRGELERVLKERDRGDERISMEEKGGYEESWCEKYADNSNGLAGYNDVIEAVVIDPRGTVGEIIDCYGLRIALPKAPIEKKDFTNGHIKTRRSQKWSREKKPDGIKRETEQAHKSYIIEQFNKKRNGAWFLNNGEPTYLTGAHWFLLQWGKTNADHGGYFHFRKAHMKLFYFLEAAYVDKRSLGVCMVKTRRTGATLCGLDFQLCKSITKEGVAFGMTSKTSGDAKKNFGYLTKMFRYLPFWFKPLVISDDSKTKIEFLQPQQKTSIKNKDKETSYVALETEISHLATSEDSYDGYALDIYLADEFSKWPAGLNIDKHWEKASLAMTEGSNIRGMAFLFSTVEHVTGIDDPDSDDARSGDKFKRLYYDSDINERNKNGHTKTMLYKLFIPCYDNYGGHIDEYGNCIQRMEPGEKIVGVDGEWIETGVLDYLEAKAASFSNAGVLNDFWRKNPRDEEEAFRVASEDCIFKAIDKILAQINDNQKFMDTSTGKSELYETGRFEWENGVIDSRVVFVPDKSGKWYVAWVPEPHEQNRCALIGNLKRPMNIDMGHISVDPYRANKVKGGGSKAGIHGVKSFDDGGAFFLEYIDREQDVDGLAEEIIKVCVFYGMQALTENNVCDTLKIMKNRGYRKYSMDRPDKPPKKLSGNDKDYGGIPGTSKDLIGTLTNQIEMYITNFMDVDDPEMRHNMPFNRTLLQWMSYNPEKRTKYDAAVSSSLAIFANNKALRSSEKREKQRVNMTGVIQKYKRDGYRTKQLHIPKRGST